MKIRRYKRNFLYTYFNAESAERTARRIRRELHTETKKLDSDSAFDFDSAYNAKGVYECEYEYDLNDKRGGLFYSKATSDCEYVYVYVYVYVCVYVYVYVYD